MMNNTSNIQRMSVKEKPSTWEGLIKLFIQKYEFFQNNSIS
jgi:hypothetical protein